MNTILQTIIHIDVRELAIGLVQGLNTLFSGAIGRVLLERKALKKYVAARRKQWTLFLKKQWTNLAMVAMVLSVGLTTIMPGQAVADSDLLPSEAEKQAVALMIDAMHNTQAPYGELPVADLRGPSYTMQVTTTAYSSEPWQTDSTPFITADGTYVHHGVIAANFLPIGTKVKIPELYGDQVFTVHDRMNARYWYRVDIWMEDTQDAREYGVKSVEIEVYK